MSGQEQSTMGSVEKSQPAQLRLVAQSAEEVDILSAMLQDSLVFVSDIAWSRDRRSLGINLQRYRWEKAAAGRADARGERVACSLCIDCATSVRSRGIIQGSRSQAAYLLRMQYEGAEDSSCGGGRVRLLFAGGDEIQVDIECIEMRIADVSEPWLAEARPTHPVET